MFSTLPAICAALLSKETDGDLLLRAARTRRCAGEGELVFGFTKHVVSLSGGMAGGQRVILPCRRPQFPFVHRAHASSPPRCGWIHFGIMTHGSLAGSATLGWRTQFPWDCAEGHESMASNSRPEFPGL